MALLFSYDPCSVAVAFLSIFHLTVAQVPFPRMCPDVKVQNEFSVDAYMGVWYEYSKYPYFFELGKRCMFARYSNKGNNTISVVNTAINILTGTTSNITGVAKVLKPGQLSVLFNKYANDAERPNYLVLGTDYTSYAVVYSCANLATFAHTELLWILTRERKPSPEAINAAKKIIDDNNLSQTFLVTSRQDGCPETVPSTGTNINILPGVISESANNSGEHIDFIDIPAESAPTGGGGTDQPLTTEDVVDAFVTETANVIARA